MMCDACQHGKHADCAPVPDAEVDMRFSPCTCLADHPRLQTDAKVADLIRQMGKAHRQDLPKVVVQGARKVIALLDPPKGRFLRLVPEDTAALGAAAARPVVNRRSFPRPKGEVKMGEVWRKTLEDLLAAATTDKERNDIVGTFGLGLRERLNEIERRFAVTVLNGDAEHARTLLAEHVQVEEAHKGIAEHPIIVAARETYRKQRTPSGLTAILAALAVGVDPNPASRHGETHP